MQFQSAVSHFLRIAANQPQHERVAAFVFDPGLIFIGIDCLPGLIEVFRADMKWLVNVTDVVRQQDHRDRFGDLARIIFRDFAAQNIDAIGDHVDDVPLAATGFSVGVLLGVENRHVGVMKPVM